MSCVFFFLPAGLHSNSMFLEMYHCGFLFFIVTEGSWSLKVRLCIWSKMSPGLWHGGRAILSTASQTYITSQYLISWITRGIPITGKCLSALVYGSPCCHCCSSVFLLDFHVQLYVHPHFASFPLQEWVMKAFLFLNLAALLPTVSRVKFPWEKSQRVAVSSLFKFLKILLQFYLCNT